MGHTLVAEITGRTDLQVDVVLPDQTLHTFATLSEAEEYCFSLGATAVASVQGRKGYLRATTYVEESKDAKGVARIGNGTKLHTAMKSEKTGFIQCICGCPGTSNNHARITGFWIGIDATCRR